MKNVIKWIGIVLGGLVALVVIVLIVLVVIGNGRYGKAYALPSLSVTVPTDSASVQRGKHFAEAIVGCVGCHEKDLGGGTAFMDDAAVGKVYAANLTSGKGGIAKQYSDEDWVRAIRHGIGKSGKPLAIMPSNWYYFVTNRDLGDTIAYIKSAKPVDREVPATSIGFMGSILLATGGFPTFPADLINHTGERPDATREAISADYGLYLSRIGACRECHGASLTGGKPPEPDAPNAPDITPAALGKWSETEFLRTLRSGVRPDGKQMNRFMPTEFGGMTNNELKALWMYLLSLRR